MMRDLLLVVGLVCLVMALSSALFGAHAAVMGNFEAAKSFAVSTGVFSALVAGVLGATR